MNEILGQFRQCFSRSAAYGWFVTIVTGLVVRSDHLGVTSVIRALNLRPELYETMMHFFRAFSWNVTDVRRRWLEVVKKHAPVCKEGGYTILIGDGVKQAREARHMPGVKKLVQESENSSKPTYIFGHMFGALGVLIGNTGKRFCLPLSIRLHDGLQFLDSWDEKTSSSGTHVTKMIQDAFDAVKVFGNSLLLLDRYFLSVPALELLDQLNAQGNERMEIVTRAKSNCIAYEEPIRKSGRGRPPRKGAKVVLKDLFTSEDVQFQKAELELYGKPTPVEYYCIDLLWGQGLYKKLRFVLVRYGKTQSILVSTYLDLQPERIICLYGHRFSIESCFREMKQQIGGFRCHFWTRFMPKLSHFQKKGSPDPLEAISDLKMRNAIRATAEAVDRFVMLSCIAMGILQMIALRFSDVLRSSPFRYIRTQSNMVVSEAAVMSYLRQNIFRFIALCPDCPVSHFILAKSTPPADFQAA